MPTKSGLTFAPRLLGRGLDRHLAALPEQKVWDVAMALDIDPERLPWATDTNLKSREVRRAILAQLREEGQGA